MEPERDLGAVNPLPELPDFAADSGRFFSYIWDTTGVPEMQVDEHGVTIITPQFHNLVIYGRELQASDHDEAQDLRRSRRILGYWYSLACPEGEAGTVPEEVCQQIGVREFSEAYQRNWERKGE